MQFSTERHGGRYRRLAMKPIMRLSTLALVVGTLVPACGSSSGSGGPGTTGPSSSSGGGSGGGTSSGGTFAPSDGGTTTKPPTITADAGCATATASAKRTPVYMLFVLDGSGSMGQDNKWTAVTGALGGLFGQMSGDPSIGAGLIVFADSLDQTMNSGPGPYPEQGIDVPIGEITTSHSAALAARLSGSPSSNTPTYFALQGGYGELSTFTAAAPLEKGGQKILVLITDGVPTDHYCSTSHAGTNYPTNPCVVMAAKEAAAASPAGPIMTFVIGTGQFPSGNAQGFDPEFLGYLAQAGGGAPKGCDPTQTQSASNLCYFEVDPTKTTAAALEQAFTNALNAIRGQVLSCTFPLETTGLGTIDPSQVNVDVDGTTVPQSSTDGWTYDNPTSPTSIVFNGAACTSLKADPSAQVSIVIGCATVTR
jgi:hypothetical protein